MTIIIDPKRQDLDPTKKWLGVQVNVPRLALYVEDATEPAVIKQTVLVARDSRGLEIPRVSIEPGRVELKVTVVQQEISVQLPIIAALQGTVTAVDTVARKVTYRTPAGATATVSYSRLVMAPGIDFLPIPGLTGTTANKAKACRASTRRCAATLRSTCSTGALTPATPTPTANRPWHKSPAPCCLRWASKNWCWARSCIRRWRPCPKKTEF